MIWTMIESLRHIISQHKNQNQLAWSECVRQDTLGLGTWLKTALTIQIILLIIVHMDHDIKTS